MKRRNSNMRELLGRRQVLTGASAALLIAAVDGCSVGVRGTKRTTLPNAALQLAPLHASTDRITISSYARLLMSDFLANGGKIEISEFHSPGDFAKLREKTLINATGYGARALFSDESVTPVRGRLARMIPQPDISYGLFYKGVSFVPRRDGLVFQAVGDDDYYGFSDATTLPDRAEAEFAVNTIAGLYKAA